MLDVTERVMQLRADWLARLPEPDASGYIRTGTPETTASVMESVRVSSVLAQYARAKYEPTQQERRVLRLAERAEAVDTRRVSLGLSNPTYLAAASDTQFMRVEIDSAEVRFSFSDPISETLTPQRGGGRRGEITELSEGARGRLAARAWALSAEGHEPSDMITLTAPANWESIYVADADGVALSGGRIFKRHVDTFRKRLGRFLARYGVAEWSALWFLEFQARGAPHIHLMVFGCEVTSVIRRALRSWCGPAWSSIVGNPSKFEQEKHKRTCSRVEKMRCKHFGYAVKYATKTEQKEVPPCFRDVGRFWGCWNYKHPEPVVVHFDFSHLNRADAFQMFQLAYSTLATLPAVGRSFAASRLAKVSDAVTHGLKHAFGFRVFGTDAVRAARAYLGEVAA